MGLRWGRSQLPLLSWGSERGIGSLHRRADLCLSVHQMVYYKVRGQSPLVENDQESFGGWVGPHPWTTVALGLGPFWGLGARPWIDPFLRVGWAPPLDPPWASVCGSVPTTPCADLWPCGCVCPEASRPSPNSSAPLRLTSRQTGSRWVRRACDAACLRCTGRKNTHWCVQGYSGH